MSDRREAAITHARSVLAANVGVRAESTDFNVDTLPSWTRTERPLCFGSNSPAAFITRYARL